MRWRLEEFSLTEGGLVRREVFRFFFWICLLRGLTCGRVGNTRVISQSALDHFRTSLSTKQNDPYSVLLRRNKLPMDLLDDASNSNLRKVCSGFLDFSSLVIIDFGMDSVHILSRRNRLRTRLVRKLNGSGLGWTSVILKS